MKKLLSIIISTKDKNPDVLKRTILSIVSQDFSGLLEIIIIDQNQDKRMESVCREISSLDIIYQSSDQIGLSNGRNLGFGLSSGDWLLFFDDDAVFGEGALKNIKNELEIKRSEKIIYYGKILNLEDNKNYLTRHAHGNRIGYLNFDGVCSIGLLFNRLVIEAVGLFDKNFGVGAKYGAGEESDMILRAIDKQIEILSLPNFAVSHPRALLQKGKAATYGFGLGVLYRKHIFDSFRSFICLSVKLILEVVGRLVLSSANLFIHLDKTFYHVQYVVGFLKGLFSYESINRQ